MCSALGGEVVMPSGPRVIFKDDRDSSVKRGCHLYGGHFRPEMAIIPYVVAKTAPEQLESVVFTEGFRAIREWRDLHNELRALDVSLNGIEPTALMGDLDNDELMRHRRRVGIKWADRIRKILGSDYHVVVHGDGFNCHIHIELDPR